MDPLRQDELERLLQPSVLGSYSSLEVTSLLLTEKTDKKNFNLLTLIVAKRGSVSSSGEIKFVGKRIEIPGVPGLSFGITQHDIPLSELPSAIKEATVDKKWSRSGGTFHFSELSFKGHWFSRSDLREGEIALNQVLKNNFWNGSHVWEWVDTNKNSFQPLLKEPSRLQHLSAEISAMLPIRLAAVSDKLGSLIVQLPVQVLNATFWGRGDRGGAVANLQWQPGANPRNVTITIEREHDGLLAESTRNSSKSEDVELILPDSTGSQFATIKDVANGDILGRHCLNFVRQINVGIHVPHFSRRTFYIPEPSATKRHEIEISSNQAMRIGNRDSLRQFVDTDNRLYQGEMDQLRARLELVQYRPDSSKGADLRHEEALGDLRNLISRYGQNAVWLWDPFLTSVDVLKTLFFNPHADSQMRALSGATAVNDDDLEETPTPTAGPAASRREKFVADQRSELVRFGASAHGLHLEFRARSDAAGWSFHDRFIICPQPEGPALVWSLGTSVNSFGKQHHILQKVPDGQLIADAFEDLWRELDQAQHLIWKKP